MIDLSAADLIAVGAVILSAGGSLTWIAALKERTARLERGASAQGKRLEDLNLRLTVIEYSNGIRRPSVVGVPTDESSHG